MKIDSTVIWSLISMASGACLGGYISYRSAISVLKRQERYKARVEFIDSFSEIQRLLEIMHPNHSSEYKQTSVLLKEHYNEMRIGILKFKQALKPSDAEKLEVLWKNLCSFDEKHNYPTFKEFRVIDNDHEKEVEKRKLALDYIQKMFSFAKIK